MKRRFVSPFLRALWPVPPEVVRAMTPSEVSAVLGTDVEEVGIGGRGLVVPVPMEMKPPPTRVGTSGRGPRLRAVVPVSQDVPTPPVKKKEPRKRQVRKVV